MAGQNRRYAALLDHFIAMPEDADEPITTDFAQAAGVLRSCEREMERRYDRLAEVGVPAGKMRTLDEVYEWDQTASQGLVVDVEHAALGTVSLPGPPLRFFADEGEVVRTHTAPPVLDQHGAEIRAWLEDDA